MLCIKYKYKDSLKYSIILSTIKSLTLFFIKQILLLRRVMFNNKVMLLNFMINTAME